VVSVALVGPDGAGKSTVSRLLEKQDLPAPVKRIYMGVNLESSSLMLPTTRVALAWKQARGRTADMAAPHEARAGTQRRSGPAARLLGALRMTLWMAEEWFRALVALAYLSRGTIVIFDRHFFADYYHYDIAAGGTAARRPSRVHGYMLRRFYPKPDLVICLDAPGEVLHRRKQEASVEWLENRRMQYLELGSVVPNFRVVDAGQPLEDVAREVAALVSQFHREDS
jgi:thymidylate kinase